MTIFVALLRAINVGGTGKLLMSDLKALCAASGLVGAQTYIQSGNVVFESRLSEAKVKAKLEQALARQLGKPVGVLVRTLPELEQVLSLNPFASALPNQVLVLFLDVAPAPGALANVVIPGREVLELRGRELFIHFPDGLGQSKLKIPFAQLGTGRNLNTVTKLVALARAR
jgi:uncharacterized protein (DUF1697 family)